MPCRKVPLVKNELYHIYSRSIAEYVIFNSEKEYRRMTEEIYFFSFKHRPCKFSQRNKANILRFQNEEKEVDIIAYCLMPTHLHFIIKGSSDNSISKFMHSILKSYSYYFNLRHKRNGPLWESRFNNILIHNDDQLIHLTRYIHLNPVTAHMIKDPADWPYSSYKEYINTTASKNKLTIFPSCFGMSPTLYKDFVCNHIEYQQELAKIKKLCLD